jgi:hypothetical protein
MPELRGGRTDPLGRIPSVKRAIPFIHFPRLRDPLSRFTSFILLSSACPSSSSCSSVLLHGPSSCTAILSPVVSPPSPSQTFYGRKTAVSLDKPNPNLNTAPPPAVNCRPVWRQRPHHHAPLPTQPPTLPPSSPPFGITPTTTPSHSDFTLGSERRRKEVVDRAEAPRVT